MAGEYYDHTSYPATGSSGSSAAMRAELEAIQAGFDKLPGLAANPSKVVVVNAGGTALDTAAYLSVSQGGTGAATLPANNILAGNGTSALQTIAPGTSGNILTSNGTNWVSTTPATNGSVTAVSVTSANGFAGTVATPNSTPAISLSTTVTGVLKGNGTAISAATAGTDYLAPPSGTAILRANSGGALANAVAGTHYIAPGGALGTPASGTLTNCTVDGTVDIGYRTIPQVSKSASYTLVADDSGKHIFHPASDANSRTFTIPANSSVPYPIGTALTFINQYGGGVSVTIAITTDTMRISPSGQPGSRTLATGGIATAIKITSTEWIISGTGLT